MRFGSKNKAAAVLLVAAAFAVSGCLSAQEQDVVSYDPATDDFRALMVLTDIRGTDTSDLEYFSRIYQNRDHLIAPMPLPIPIIDPMFLRISDTECAFLSMFDQPTHDLSGIKTDIPLSSITITPGSLFVQDGKLCYYQALKIPGKTLDMAVQQLFGMMLDMARDRVSKGLQKELDRRAAGGAVKTWPEVTDKLIHGIDETLAQRTAGTGATPRARAGYSSGRFSNIDLAVLQTKSIQRLKMAVDKEDLHITRQGQQLDIVLPFEPSDCQAIEETVRKVHEHMGEITARADTLGAEDRKVLDSLNKSSMVVHLKAETGGLGLRLDLVEMAKTQGTIHRRSLIETLQHHGPDSQPDAQHKPGTPDPIAFARSRQLPLDETLTAQKIIDNFNAQKLGAKPPAAIPAIQGFSVSAPKAIRDLLRAWGVGGK